MPISLNSTPEKTLSNNNTSRYVAAFNPLLFTFTASGSPVPTKVKIDVVDADTTNNINANDLIFFFNTSNTFVFDASPYVKDYINRVIYSDWTTEQQTDDNVKITFYIRYTEEPDSSPTTAQISSTFNCIYSVKQILQTYGQNLGDLVPSLGKADGSLIDTGYFLNAARVSRIKAYRGYPFALPFIYDNSLKNVKLIESIADVTNEIDIDVNIDEVIVQPFDFTKGIIYNDQRFINYRLEAQASGFLLPTAILGHWFYKIPRAFTYTPTDYPEQETGTSIQLDGTVYAGNGDNYKYDVSGITTTRDREPQPGRCLIKTSANPSVSFDFSGFVSGTMTIVAGWVKTSGGSVSENTSLTTEISGKVFTPQLDYKYHDLSVLDDAIEVARFRCEQRINGVLIDASGNGNHKAGTSVSNAPLLWTTDDVNYSYANGDNSGFGYSLATNTPTFDGVVVTSNELMPAISATLDADNQPLQYRGVCANDGQILNNPSLDFSEITNSTLAASTNPSNMDFSDGVREYFATVVIFQASGNVNRHITRATSAGTGFNSMRSRFNDGGDNIDYYLTGITAIGGVPQTPTAIQTSGITFTGGFDVLVIVNDCTDFQANDNITHKFYLNGALTDTIVTTHAGASTFSFAFNSFSRSGGDSNDHILAVAAQYYSLSDFTANELIAINKGEPIASKTAALIPFSLNAGQKIYDVIRDEDFTDSGTYSGNEWNTTQDVYAFNQSKGANKFENLQEANLQLTSDINIGTSQFKIETTITPTTGFEDVTPVQSRVYMLQGSAAGTIIFITQTQINISTTIGGTFTDLINTTTGLLPNESNNISVERNGTGWSFNVNGTITTLASGSSNTYSQSFDFRYIHFIFLANNLLPIIDAFNIYSSDTTTITNSYTPSTGLVDSVGGNDIQSRTVINGYLPTALDSNGDSTGQDVQSNTLTATNPGFDFVDLQEDFQPNPNNVPLLRNQYSIDDAVEFTYANLTEDNDGSGYDRKFVQNTEGKGDVIFFPGTIDPADETLIDDFLNR